MRTFFWNGWQSSTSTAVLVQPNDALGACRWLVPISNAFLARIEEGTKDRLLVTLLNATSKHFDLDPGVAIFVPELTKMAGPRFGHEIVLELLGVGFPVLLCDGAKRLVWLGRLRERGGLARHGGFGSTNLKIVRLS